jgi:hypothetical protein
MMWRELHSFLKDHQSARPEDMTQAQTKFRARVKIDPAHFLSVELR